MLPPPAIVYSRSYDIHFFGVERMHPFDSRKYSKAFKELRRRFHRRLDAQVIAVDRPASLEELASVHSADYLRRIQRSDVCAVALEIPILRRAPGWFLQWRIGFPMRCAVRGTVLAAQAAIERGLAFNLSGGYHHAKPDQGEGFCLFSDIALAIHVVRQMQPGEPAARIAYIDLDAHQGNGVCHQFLDDREVYIFDMYNAMTYPWYDLVAKQRIDCDLPLRGGCAGQEYLDTLKSRLPGFLNSVTSTRPVTLAIYNAGTDVFVDDQLGGLNLTADEVLARDRFVIEECRARKIPLLVLPSGGYSRESFRLIADTIATCFEAEV